MHLGRKFLSRRSARLCSAYKMRCITAMIVIVYYLGLGQTLRRQAYVKNPSTILAYVTMLHC